MVDNVCTSLGRNDCTILFAVDEEPGLPTAMTAATVHINGGETPASEPGAQQFQPPAPPASTTEMLPPPRTPASSSPASARVSGGETPASSIVTGPIPPQMTPTASSSASTRINGGETPTSSTVSGPIPAPTVPEVEGDSASGTCFPCMNIE